ncbi:MAG: ATP-binding cassette domain-containing protein [Jatrophihabitantaceae bacterium]
MSPGRHAAPDAGEPDYFEIEFEPHVEAPQLPPQPLLSGTVSARGLCFARAGRTILDGVSLTAHPGQALAVTGPSGSGKSSLLALLAGLEQPDAGEVRHDRAPGRRGLVLQGYGLVGVLTAAENVEVALQGGAAGVLRPDEVRRRAGAALAAVGLDEVAEHLVEELSGGQQQRVAVARALVVDPELVFADELSAELDHDWKQRVLDLVLDVARRGGVVVLATHDAGVAARCDRVVRLVDGRIDVSDDSGLA